MVVGNRGFMPVVSVGSWRLPAQQYIDCHYIGEIVRLREIIASFGEKKRTNYYIEEFAAILRKRLH